eukprot:CAMPEP_0196811238 /NCGR_PEP_ID=MMETSP1362-20130617/17028_1 /TAXON_ID=163516 /ORGANISM="Leptocylindrus danicus, Strain CCMP1856" /LENGTH=450 /DNA_ID=CAMNT_0042186507 /DNA_START=123 /DNA_END=1472 /DNA_ORIENTATION=+
MKVTNCIPVNTWTEFTEAIGSNSNGVLHFCPFDITHDGNENDGYDLTSDFLHLGCDKKTGTAGDAVEQIKDGSINTYHPHHSYNNNHRRTGATTTNTTNNYAPEPISSQDTPKCIIRGTARHLNVRNKGLTMIGFDFYDSEHTAVHVSDDADMATFLHLAFVDNIINNDQGGAMSIAAEATKTTILHCEFTSNEATDGGGAIYHAANGADLTVYRSFFHTNYAVEGDGAAVSTHGANFTVSRSEFFSNTVSNVDVHGPAIFDGSSVSCDAGENIACLNRNLETGEACDGIYYDDDALCHEFDGACEAPSISPTVAPTLSPSVRPTSAPTVSPSLSHVPTAMPSISLVPSMTPSVSSAPSIRVTAQKLTDRPHPQSPAPTPAPQYGKGKGKGGKGGKGGKAEKNEYNNAEVSHDHHDNIGTLGNRAMKHVRGGSNNGGSSGWKGRRGGLHW